MKKRALALVCAFVMGMTLSAGTDIGMTAKAAGEEVATPAVTIKGATISKESGTTQSLRFLMEVENYDQIKVSKGQDFGMNIKVGDKIVPVSYKNYQNIYAVDETANTLQYVVDITGISATNIATDITATGFVTDVPDAEASETTNIAESDAATRNVKGVAEAAGYKINVAAGGDMTLALNIKGGAIAVDLSDSSSYLLDGKDMVASYDVASNVLNVNFSDFQGIIIKNPAENPSEYGYATVVYEADDAISSYYFDGAMGDNGCGENPAGNKKSNNLSKTTERNTVTYKAENGMYGVKFAKVFNPGKKLAIKSVVFTKKPVEPYELIFGADTVFCDETYSISDNKVHVSIDAKYGGIIFSVPESKKDETFDTVTIYYENATNVGDGFGASVYSNIGESVKHWSGLCKDNKGSLTFKLDTGYLEKLEKVKLFNNTGTLSKESTADITITSVVFSDSRWINPADVVESYELQLTSDYVVGNNKVNLTFNADNTFTIETLESGGEFGFKLPRKVYQANDFKHIVITYKGSDLTGNVHYTQHYGTDEIWYIKADNGTYNGGSMMGDGTVTLDVNKSTEGSYFSTSRIFDLAAGKKATITSIKLTK